MDKRNTLHKLIAMLKNRDGQVLHINEIRNLIALNIGVSEQTMVGHLRNLGMLGFIKEVDHLKFKVTLPNEP